MPDNIPDRIVQTSKVLFSAGEEYTCVFIVDAIHSATGIAKDSIIPSAYCYNCTNAGIDHEDCPHIFELVGPAKYRYLGDGEHYGGKIHWQNTVSGEWHDGVSRVLDKDECGVGDRTVDNGSRPNTPMPKNGKASRILWVRGSGKSQYDAIVEAAAKLFQVNLVYTRQEIIDAIHYETGIPVGSILPSDHCYNIINGSEMNFTKPRWIKSRLFEYLSNERQKKYRYLGSGIPYSGVVTRGNVTIEGRWKYGVFTCGADAGGAIENVKSNSGAHDEALEDVDILTIQGSIVGNIVTHRTLGKGIIVHHEKPYITVRFGHRQSKFKYPKSFGTFLSTNDIALIEALGLSKKSVSESPIQPDRSKSEHLDQRVTISKPIESSGENNMGKYALIDEIGGDEEAPMVGAIPDESVAPPLPTQTIIEETDTVQIIPWKIESSSLDEIADISDPTSRLPWEYEEMVLLVDFTYAIDVYDDKKSYYEAMSKLLRNRAMKLGLHIGEKFRNPKGIELQSMGVSTLLYGWRKGKSIGHVSALMKNVVQAFIEDYEDYAVALQDANGKWGYYTDYLFTTDNETITLATRPLIQGKTSTTKDVVDEPKINAASGFKDYLIEVRGIYDSIADSGIHGKTIDDIVVSLDSPITCGQLYEIIINDTSIVMIGDGRYIARDIIVDIDDVADDMMNILDSQFSKFDGYSNSQVLYNAVSIDLPLFLNDNDFDENNIYYLAKHLFEKEKYSGVSYYFREGHSAKDIFRDASDGINTLKGQLTKVAKHSGGIITRRQAETYLSQIKKSLGTFNSAINNPSDPTYYQFDDEAFVLSDQLDIDLGWQKNVKAELDLLMDNRMYVIPRDIEKSWYQRLPSLHAPAYWTPLLLQETIKYNPTIGYKSVFAPLNQKRDTISAAFVKSTSEYLFADIVYDYLLHIESQVEFPRKMMVEDLRKILKESGMIKGNELIQMHKALPDRRFHFSNGNKEVVITR